MSFLSMNIAASGLRSQQSYIDTISKNIANKDVPGYKREEGRFSTLQSNGGVQYKASTNNFPWLDNNLALKSTEYSKQIRLKESADNLDNLFSNNNVDEAFGNFLNASKNLQMFPNSKQYLDEFNAAGKFFNDSMVQVSDSLDQMKRTNDKKIEFSTTELDSLKTQLEKMTESGVNENNATQIQDVKQKIATLTGEISGYREFGKNIIEPAIESYKSLTSDTMDKINTAGNSLMFSNGQWIDQSSVNSQSINNSTDIFNFTELFSKLKMDAGLNSNNSELSRKYAENEYEQASKEYDGAYGVELEQEMVNMMKAQRMYEANAKMIQTADSMMGTLLNVVG